MKKSLFLSFLLLTALNVFAHERTIEQMRAIAVQVISPVATRSVGTADVRLLSEQTSYCILGTDQAFVVVSRDSQAKPVLGYSFTAFRPDRLPCGLQCWLHSLQTAALPAAAPSTRAYQPVDALLKSTWGQEDPYNKACPTIQNTRPPCGCVATAMGQIMKYYEYPAQAKGKGSYTTPTKRNRSQSLSTTYTWSNILNSYARNAGSSVQKYAVGQLLYDVGCSVKMTYDLEGSGALSVYVPLGLIDNFSYDSLSVHLSLREYYTAQEWHDLVVSELMSGRPVYYGANDAIFGGHAFVIDGVDAAGLVHVNWGWDGDGDGFYDLATLSPTRYGKPTGYIFDQDPEMVWGICPPSAAADALFSSNWVGTESYEITPGDNNTIYFNGYELASFQPTSFDGELGLLFDDVDGRQPSQTFCFYSPSSPYYQPVAYIEGLSYYDDDDTVYPDTIDITALQPGTYRVTMYSKDKRESMRQPIRTIGGVSEQKLQKLADGTIIVNDTLTSAIRTVEANPVAVRRPSTRAIYDLHGRYVGADLQGLPHGVYIVGGRKVVK